MKAVKSIDIGSAHVLLLQSSFPTLFPLTDEARGGLEQDFKEMNQVYQADPTFLLNFSEFHRNDGYAIARVKPTKGGDGKGFVLILSLSPKGWRIAHMDQINRGDSLSKKLGEWIKSNTAR